MTKDLENRIAEGIAKDDENLQHWLTLQERIIKSERYLDEYGVENFCMSFSGGKDSCVMSYLIDLAMPDNGIPRVYADTGIELNMIRDFVKARQKEDDRIVIIKPSKNIKKMLEEVGYPFKSKVHSHVVNTFQKIGFESKFVRAYTGMEKTREGKDVLRPCPKILKYQFTPEFLENGLKISDKCCEELKEKPLENYKKEHGYLYDIIGIMRDEGGRRDKAKCLAFRGNKLKAFQPLAPVTKAWEDWFVKEFDIPICDIYKPPYNFERTGWTNVMLCINLVNS